MFATLHSIRRLTSISAFKSGNIRFHKGSGTYKDTKDVQLRGVTLKGRFNDLPNMVFLPEAFDSVENWVPFFTDPNNNILDYRNVHIVQTRNFGNSDHNESFDLEDVSNDVLRYLWENKLSTATLAGHGYGGKVALATGCYYPERTTGVFVVDSSPLDHRYHESYQELKGYVKQLSQLTLPSNKGEVDKLLKEKIECPKWRSLFGQNIVKSSSKEGGMEWRLPLSFINKNMQFNKADSLANWPIKVGLFTGRAWFVFPEYSRWVHLNTNTIPMMTICPQVKGFGHDIFSIQGDENPLNHWMYDFADQAFSLSRRLVKFLSQFDGVHVLLQDRSEVGNYFIPDRINSRSNAEHVYGDYTPAHLHHNWRYNDVYNKMN